MFGFFPFFLGFGLGAAVTRPRYYPSSSYYGWY